jgi:hypothetical protein
MKKNSAYLLYDPLSLTVTMQFLGGSESQTCSAATGTVTYDPDRTFTPLQLKPLLMITDPEGILEDGDYSSHLQACHWYLGSDNTGELILSTTQGYDLGDNGALTVWKNIPPTTTQPLYFEGKFVDDRTGRAFVVSSSVVLATTQSQDVQLRLQTDWVNPMSIPVFKDLAERTLGVELYNGENKIDDEYVNFVWKIYDATYNGTGDFREIGEDDPCYVSGQGTSKLTIDRRFIDKERIICEANLVTYPNIIKTARCLAYRDYGQWQASAPIFTQGRYIRTTTQTVATLEQITTPRGAVSTPEKYFDIEHVLLSGSNQLTIGYGSEASVDANVVRGLDTREPVFGVQVMTRSALRPLTIDGQLLSMDGQIVCVQLPLKT